MQRKINFSATGDSPAPFRLYEWAAGWKSERNKRFSRDLAGFQNSLKRI